MKSFHIEDIFQGLGGADSRMNIKVYAFQYFIAGFRAIQWVNQEKPSEVCMARLGPLQLWDTSDQMNVARRKLYDDLEAQLGRMGLMLGERHTDPSPPSLLDKSYKVLCSLSHAVWAPGRSAHSAGTMK